MKYVRDQFYEMQLIHCNLDAMIEDGDYFSRERCMCREGV